MSKRDPADYSLDDVRIYVAEANGYTLPQIIALDFPGPDYEDGEGLPYWTLDTVYVWLNSLHAAMIVLERAHHPERFEDFARLVTEAMGRQSK